MSQTPPLPPPLAPVPVMSLNYGSVQFPPDDRRPGVLLAIGIFSLLVALASALACGWLTNTWWNVYCRSVPPPAPVAPAGGPTPLAAITPHLGDYIGAHGMKRDARQAAVDAVRAKTTRFLPDHAIMLQRLLADAGQEIFPGADASYVAEQVGEAGRDTSDPNDGIGGRQWFTTPAGRVEVTSFTAQFSPTGRKAPTHQIKGNLHLDEDGREWKWSAASIDQLLESERQRTGGRLNALQAGAMIAKIEPPGPQADRSTGGAGPAISAQPAPEGAFIVMTPHQRWWVYPNGRVADGMRYPDGVNAATGLPLAPKRSFQPLFGGNPRLMLALSVEYAMGAALALILLVAGVGLLCENAWAPRLHVWFGLGKLLLVASDVLLSMWLFHTMTAPGAARGSAVFNTNRGLNGVMTATVVSIIYPTVLLILFFSARVRMWLSRHGQDVWIVPPGLGAKFDALACGGKGRLAVWGVGGVACAAAALHVTAAATSGGSAIGNGLGAAVAIAIACACGRQLLKSTSVPSVVSQQTVHSPFRKVA